MARTEIPTDKARQGHWGRHTLTILISALILAMIAWAGVEVYGQLIGPEEPAQTSQDL